MNTGDAVQLKSGGPRMCVLNSVKYTDSIGYLCGWFDVFDKYQTATFSEECLKVII